MATATRALGAHQAGGPFVGMTIERRAPGPRDVVIDIAHAGICHSDLHQIDADWGNKIFPMVPGHEIAGIVAAVGPEVTKFSRGDRVGVGVWVDSCGVCSYCQSGHEPHCTKGAVLTYNSRGYDGEITYGGYSQRIVVTDRFVMRIPDALNLDVAAPLLCAGVTTYAPLKRFQVGGKRIAILGLGGLGHIAVQIAHAMGAHVTVLSRGRDKEAEARRFHADDYVATSEPGVLKALDKRFDAIFNTVAANLDLNVYLRMLRVGGALVGLGLPPKPDTFDPFLVVGGERIITGSNTGGMPDTQEMLNFCAANAVAPQIERVTVGDVPHAYDRLRRSDVRYRFVIDTTTF